MKKIMNKINIMAVLVVFGLSVPAFAVMDVTEEGKNLADFESVSVAPEYGSNSQTLAGLLDVSAEGRNPLNFENVSEYRDNRGADSQIANNKHLQDITSNYGIAPAWGNADDGNSWFNVNVIEGR